MGFQTPQYELADYLKWTTSGKIQLPDFQRWGIMTMVAILIAWMGFAWFQKTRKGFADVL